MIRVTPKGFLPRIQTGKAVVPSSGDKKTEQDRTVESPRIDIFRDVRKPQKVVHPLPCKGELRAEKVRRIRKLIANGQYEVDPREVAQSIIRAARQRGKLQSMDTDVAAWLPVTEKGTTACKKKAAHVEDQKKPIADGDVGALAKQFGAEPSLASAIFSDRRI
jgi:anti-sigma28 factor (negative regulator of flagellin synthesis)